MPRLIRIEGLPLMVQQASEMTSSHLRLRLIRHYRSTPGSQADAAEALGVSASSLTRNIRALLEIGVLVEQEPPVGRRGSRLAVDAEKVRQLLSALNDYLTPGDDQPDT